MKVWSTALTLVLAVLLTAAGDASAQKKKQPAAKPGEPYPSRPVRLIVPFPAGGGVDLVNRILASRLSEVLGQQIVVDNRSGAGGNVGADVAAKSTPDGYTLFACGVASHGVSPAIYRKLPFDAIKDFEPISMIGTTPNVLIVNPNVPAKTIAEFIAHAKSAKVSWATPGVGTSPHMTSELFKAATGTNLALVPYKGGAPALQDVLGGHVAGMWGNLAENIAIIKSGRARPLAVSTLKRHSLLPDIPTMAESGFPSFEVTAWYASCTAAGVPKPVLDTLNAAIVKTLNMPDIRERYAQNTVDVMPTSRQELGAYMRAEIAKWTKVAKSAGISLD